MFDTIPKIEKPEFYIDLGIRSAKKYASSIKLREKHRVKRQAELESVKAETFARSIKGNIERICSAFPSLNQLPIFYKELLDAMIGADALRISIARIAGIMKTIEELQQKANTKMRKANDLSEVQKIKAEFYGRSFSITKKAKDAFNFLENARKTIKNFPSIKTKMPTVCICGYPNVGKSTLLSKMTGSTPEIAPYAFTTKQLMVGYIDDKLQIIDTPGAFTDNLKKMNWIEKQSYLAIKHLTRKIVFVFDISESCGFTIKQQEELFQQFTKRFRAKQFMIYLSKTDLGLENKQEFVESHKEHKIFDNADELKKVLVEV
ncbi:MAG: 50S ribosome-binding GTPase [Candidatus Nanoarchaeia archaeon]|nr:50S ribosome-binding GTPase [Candidatus Nanoarchaeia archaeon]